ncbi:MAG: glycosyltransferase, partial [Acidobacteriia bacterium]|nr:glycosyltransferase [Terriglobia bacterium]
MRILLIHNHYQQPGGEDVVFTQEHELLRNSGHQVLIYERTNSELLHYSLPQRIAMVKSVISSGDARKEILATLHREKPTLVHVHNSFTLISPSVYEACQEAGIPVVQTLHNFRLLCPAATFFRNGRVCEECPQFGLWRGVGHACYRGSHAATAAVALMLAVHRRRRTWVEAVNRYITLTQFALRKFVEGGIPQEKISVKPNFVSPDPGERATDGATAVFVGRLSPEKGLHGLLAAWGLLPKTIPLQIIGDGPLRVELQEQAARNNLSSVFFRGRLGHDETKEAIKSARCLVLPSECYESFPMAIVEAFACGVPVICSRLGAMQELVADGSTGLHFTPGDAEHLADR